MLSTCRVPRMVLPCLSYALAIGSQNCRYFPILFTLLHSDIYFSIFFYSIFLSNIFVRSKNCSRVKLTLLRLFRQGRGWWRIGQTSSNFKHSRNIFVRIVTLNTSKNWLNNPVKSSTCLTLVISGTIIFSIWHFSIQSRASMFELAGYLSFFFFFFCTVTGFFE